MDNGLNSPRPKNRSVANEAGNLGGGQLRALLAQAIEAIDRAPLIAEVWGPLKDFASRCSFHHMLVLEGRQELAHHVSPAILYNDMPQGFAESFDRAGHSSNNPLVLRAFTELEPFTARELWTTAISDRQKRALALLSMSLNVRDGLMVPIRAGQDLHGIVLLGGQNPDTSPIVRSALHLLAHCAFERMTELAGLPPQKVHGKLSPRELECLKWVAAGKTDGEIGGILAISPRTARFHIENAKRKFGVASRIQAVTEAYKRRLIGA
jgi:LuxR family transcriptional regulator, quorum-sensing system regulator BjaR1